MIDEHTPAPDFSGTDQHEITHTLAQYRGHWVVLYFYPQDDTPGCTTEACCIRDAYPEFRSRDIVVLGVSTDDLESHRAFSQKYSLPFPIIADPGKEIVQRYGVWRKKTAHGKEYMGTVRTTFLIDPAGLIAHIYENVVPERHAELLLSDIPDKE